MTEFLEKAKAWMVANPTAVMVIAGVVAGIVIGGLIFN